MQHLCNLAFTVFCYISYYFYLLFLFAFATVLGRGWVYRNEFGFLFPKDLHLSMPQNLICTCALPPTAPKLNLPTALLPFYCWLHESSGTDRASWALGISPTKSGGGEPAACIFCIRSTMYSRSSGVVSVYDGCSNRVTISRTITCCSSYRFRSSALVVARFASIHAGNLSLSSFIGSYRISLFVSSSIMPTSIFVKSSSPPGPPRPPDCICFINSDSMSSVLSESAAAAAVAWSPEACMRSIVRRIVSWKEASAADVDAEEEEVAAGFDAAAFGAAADLEDEPLAFGWDATCSAAAAPVAAAAAAARSILAPDPSVGCGMPNSLNKLSNCA